MWKWRRAGGGEEDEEDLDLGVVSLLGSQGRRVPMTLVGLYWVVMSVMMSVMMNSSMPGSSVLRRPIK
jgi:hypothetical protein